MLYENLSNAISSDYVNYDYDKTRIFITRRYGTEDYSLHWKDEKLWGTRFMDKEFVKYSKIRVYEKVPEGLKNEAIKNSNFIVKRFKVVCKNIGRYVFEIEGKKWILDVIFPSCFDGKMEEEIYDEYTNGVSGVRNTWRYDIFDSCMAEFLMEIVNSIPMEKRDFAETMRKIMSRFSSENSNESLIEGKWNGNYSDGTPPVNWEYTAQIYRTRMKTGEPIKYGQCWIFAECMTAALRFMGIPTRTIYAKNSHINISLNFAIDLYGYSNYDKSVDQFQDLRYFKKIENMQNFLDSSFKDDEADLSSQVLIRDDSFWNFHYWNEIYVERNGIFSWQCLDVSPVISSMEEPYSGNKILGPCPVDNIKNGLNCEYDFTYLSSSVNSPFRLWAKSVVFYNEEPVLVSFVHSIIFPFYPEYSIMARKNSSVLHNKRVMLETKKNKVTGGNSKVDITEHYKMEYEKIIEKLHANHPCIFKLVRNRIYFDFNAEDLNQYEVQQLGLDSRGVPISMIKQKCKLCEISPIPVTEGIFYVSFLIKSENGKSSWPQLIKIDR